MPITLPPISRRRFIGSTLAAAAGLALGNRLSWAADSGSADLLALFSDTHINGDPAALGQNINMTDHLTQAVAEVLAMPEKPAAVLVNGDCAHISGSATDYGQL